MLVMALDINLNLFILSLYLTYCVLAFILSPSTGSLFFCLQVDCYDHHFSGSHELIGSFKTTLAEMQIGTYISPVRLLCVCVFDFSSATKEPVILILTGTNVTRVLACRLSLSALTPKS